jgi:integral membrane protein
MPLKYIGGNEILVEVIGPIHGFLWIIYIALLGIGYIRKEWNIRAVILGGFLSILPGGPIWLERRIQNEEYLPSIT